MVLSRVSFILPKTKHVMLSRFSANSEQNYYVGFALSSHHFIDLSVKYKCNPPPGFPHSFAWAEQT